MILHGTYWSKLWQPVIGLMGSRGLRPIAVDFPGCGRSAGELALERATVPELTNWAARFLRAMEVSGAMGGGGHIIGSPIAQHLLVTGKISVLQPALVNSVLYDTWPVPSVAHFRDPAIAAATSTAEVLTARPTSQREIEDYLDPWNDPRVARSWLALSGAADNRYTLELLTGLRLSGAPHTPAMGA